VRVALIGAGNMRVAPSVVAALATTCGERPLQVHLFEANAERLDLMDRFARVCFHRTDYGHQVLATDRAEEAVMDAPLVLLALDEEGVVEWQSPSEPIPDRGEDYRPSDWSTEAWVIPGQGDRTVEAEDLVDRLHQLRRAESTWVWLEQSMIPTEAFLLEDIALPWPTKICAESPEVIPHQILRWLGGDESLESWLESCVDHPLKPALNQLEARR